MSGKECWPASSLKSDHTSSHTRGEDSATTQLWSTKSFSAYANSPGIIPMAAQGRSPPQWHLAMCAG
eukprot:4686705-Amphidinium_carterae.1